MGITWPDIAFLLAAQAQGASFERTLMIGRQNVYADANQVARAYREAGCQPAPPGRIGPFGQFAEPLFEQLGANSVESLDASDFEGATIVHDLNRPIPNHLQGRYTVVFDGGSLEHVFDVRRALKNCMEAVAVGGHFIAIASANNLLGHAFYQFSPDLYYRTLDPQNGFRIKLVLVRATHRWARWYSVADPREVRGRTELTTHTPCLLYVLAERVEAIEPLVKPPNQSDYEISWSEGELLIGKNTKRHSYSERLPAPVQHLLQLIEVVMGTRSGPGHFERVALASAARRTPSPSEPQARDGGGA